MKKTIVYISLCLAAAAGPAPCQEMLTLEEAVAAALANNFSIQTVKNKETIAAINNSAGNAGMLPKVSVNAAAGGSLLSLDQKAASGPEVTTNGVTGSAVSPSVNLTWTLFDGMRMFAEKSRLKRLAEIGELNYKDTLQTFVAAVIVSYYDLVSALQELHALQKAIAVSGERVSIAEKQFQVGTTSKVDLLQAKLDLNEQKSALLSQEEAMTQKKTALNALLARPPQTDFTVTDSIPLGNGIRQISAAELDSINFQVLAADRSLAVTRLQRKEAFSQMLPALNLNGGYGLNRTQSSAGQFLLNQNYGWSGGVSLSVPLFNGFNNIHQVQVADLNIENARLLLDNVRLQVRTRYFQSQQDLTRTTEAVKLEEENILLADENLQIALARFRLGQSTAIEMRTAELSYVDAMTRLVAARFSAKAAQTELLRIQGDLVK